MTTRFGIKLSQAAPIDDYLRVWRTSDEAGFDHVWVMDHIADLGDNPSVPIFDGWAMQAAMAVATKRVRIGCMVTGNTYRHPGMLAKLATTVDHLSGGRLEFGIGAGWAEPEHTMYGLEFGTFRERFDRLEEALQIIRSLWTEPTTTVSGTHYQLTDAVAEPKPIQRPHPPIWIGGSGPKRTLRMVAKYADAWNATGETPEEYARLGSILDQHCATVDRDPSTIRRTVQLRLGDADDLARLVADFRTAGATEFILVLPRNGDHLAVLDRTAADLDRLRDAAA
ncbi:LLM class F420-dependent oxidoreductase [Nocardioides sp. NPDC101246]|uniref:LLM class F420-dependent oxidoreductase n=1 Tax=Nocardioides sp. NPDC101246 TaxID=3364336 RepID=UPI00380DE775